MLNINYQGLLVHGADINAADLKSTTALHVAVYYSNEKLVNFLL